MVLYDPSPERTIHYGDLHYLAGYSPFEGMRVKGEVRLTISRGEIVYRDGEFPAREGHGQFVPGRPPDTGRYRVTHRVEADRTGQALNLKN